MKPTTKDDDFDARHKNLILPSNDVSYKIKSFGKLSKNAKNTRKGKKSIDINFHTHKHTRTHTYTYSKLRYCLKE